MSVDPPGDTAGLADALLIVLRAQGVAVGEDLRRRVQACQDRTVLIRALAHLAVRSKPTPAGTEAWLGSSLSESQATPSAVPLPSGCRDPAALWLHIGAELAVGLGSLDISAGSDPTAESFVTGLELIMRQMVAILPQVRSHGSRTAKIGPSREALRELLLRSVIPIVDNLYRGLRALEADRDRTPALAALWTLSSTIYKRIESLLILWDVSALDPIGQRFDPNEHEAIAQTDDERTEPDRISVVYLPGFRLGVQLLRPAQVGVVRKRVLTRVQGP